MPQNQTRPLKNKKSEAGIKKITSPVETSKQAIWRGKSLEQYVINVDWRGVAKLKITLANWRKLVKTGGKKYLDVHNFAQGGFWTYNAIIQTYGSWDMTGKQNVKSLQTLSSLLEAPWPAIRYKNIL